MEQTRILGKRILLVEDERWVRACIKRVLELDAHLVTEAASGEEAAGLFDEAKFDVVITDFSMPGMDGEQLMAYIRARSPLQPIVLITACSERFVQKDHSANAILGKPFGIAELRLILSELLRSEKPLSKDPE